MIQQGKTIEQSANEYETYLKSKVKQQKQSIEDSLIIVNNPSVEANELLFTNDLAQYGDDDDKDDDIYRKAQALMSKIATVEVTSYVLDRLSPIQAKTFVVYFDDIVKELKKLKTHSMTKQFLLEFIASYNKQKKLDTIDPSVLNARGKIKQTKQAQIEKEKTVQNIMQKLTIDEMDEQDEDDDELTKKAKILFHTLLSNEYDKQSDAIRKMSASKGRKYINDTFEVEYGAEKGSNWNAQRNSFINTQLREAILNQAQDNFEDIKTVLQKRLASSISGKGYKAGTLKKRHIVGGGYVDDTNSNIKNLRTWNYLQLNDKHILDLDKFNKNILHIKYSSKTGKQLHMLSNRNISQDCKEVIQNIIDNQFNNKAYSLLPIEERRIIKTFNNMCHYDLDIMDKEDDDNNKQFQLLLGQFQAGNNNPEIIKKLRKMIMWAINEKRITKTDGFNYLIQLTL